MINGVRFKVCGITSLVDADAADAAGADALGFILYPKSPRGITLAQFAAMKDRLPPRKRVAVSVEPTAAELAMQSAAGFDFFQVHFRAETPPHIVGSWAEAVGINRLWLAPKLPPGVDVSAGWLPFADTILIDTFDAEKFGGTGATGDWPKYCRHRDAHPRKNWILSGGLKPDNVAAAIAATGATFLDVNSGVELSPGVKDPAKLKAFVLALHNATKSNHPSYR